MIWLALVVVVLTLGAALAVVLLDNLLAAVAAASSSSSRSRSATGCSGRSASTPSTPSAQATACDSSITGRNSGSRMTAWSGAGKKRTAPSTKALTSLVACPPWSLSHARCRNGTWRRRRGRAVRLETSPAK